MKKYIILIIILTILLRIVLSSTFFFRSSIPVTIITVIDGDTFKVKDNKNNIYTIRIRDINTHEKKTPKGDYATTIAKQILPRHTKVTLLYSGIHIKFAYKDKYNRIIGDIVFQRKGVTYRYSIWACTVGIAYRY